MSQVHVEIEGLDELLADIQKRFPKQYVAAVERAMKQSVIDVEGWAKQNAPVDTGHMRASVGHEVKTMGRNVTGFVGTPVEYSRYLYPPKKPRNVGRIPWLEPAVNEHEGDILGRFKKAMDRLVSLWGD